jgi:hypothetical protein
MTKKKTKIVVEEEEEFLSIEKEKKLLKVF